MDKLMFSCDFPNLACCLQTLTQSRNNNKRPNKKNDVITDLGGEGDFPMFRFGTRLLALPRSTALTHTSLTHPGTHAAVACHNLTTLTHRGGKAACIARPTDARRSGHLARLDSGAVIPTVWAFQT